MEFGQGRGGSDTRSREGYSVDDEDDARAASGAAGEVASSSTTTTSAAGAAVEKEHMFDKVVTPSDVGKLNRLVIPKQHAEKYFPLDTVAHDKGLLLCFEDRTGKPWRFRYSYWNSSQSYVMTKGWSRFVKEKRLDAGDTVSFGRGVDDKERLFIDWKRRPEQIIHVVDGLTMPRSIPRIPLPLPAPSSSSPYHHSMLSFARSSAGAPPWAGRLLVPPAVYEGHAHHRQQNYLYNAAAAGGGGQYVFFRSAMAPQPPVQLAGSYGGATFSSSCGEHDGVVGSPMVLDSMPVVPSQAAASKRVRLFGVNLDFPDSSDSDRGDGCIRTRQLDYAASPPPSSSSLSPKGKEKEEEPSLDLDM